MRHLGPSFDIHTGGVDLIFPHHEDEIAQSEAATGQPFVGTWLHCAHLRLGGAKMAKSTGNITRVVDLLEAGVSAAGAALRADRRALPAGPRLQRRVAGCGRRGDRPARCRSWRPSTRTGRIGPTTRPAGPPRRIPVGLRGGARRRPERLGRAGRGLRPRPRHRTAGSTTGRCRPRMPRPCWLPARPRSRPRPPARRSRRPLDPRAAALLDERDAARAARDWAVRIRLRDELLGLGVAVEDTATASAGDARRPSDEPQDRPDGPTGAVSTPDPAAAGRTAARPAMSDPGIGPAAGRRRPTRPGGRGQAAPGGFRPGGPPRGEFDRARFRPAGFGPDALRAIVTGPPARASGAVARGSPRAASSADPAGRVTRGPGLGRSDPDPSGPDRAARARSRLGLRSPARAPAPRRRERRRSSGPGAAPV